MEATRGMEQTNDEKEGRRNVEAGDKNSGGRGNKSKIRKREEEKKGDSIVNWTEILEQEFNK